MRPPASAPPPPLPEPSLRAVAIIDAHVYVLLAGEVGAPTGEPHAFQSDYEARDLASPPALGQPVRVLGGDECDGTLGIPIEISHWMSADLTEHAFAAPVLGCERAMGALVAVLYPRGARATEASGSDAQAATSAAHAAVLGLTHAETDEIAGVARRFGDTTYALALQSDCESGGDEGCRTAASAVARVTSGGAAQVVFARHPDEPSTVSATIADWNGDGTADLVEAVGDNDSLDSPSTWPLLRVVPLSSAASDPVWSATGDPGSIRPRISPAPSGGPP